VPLRAKLAWQLQFGFATLTLADGYAVILPQCSANPWDPGFWHLDASHRLRHVLADRFLDRRTGRRIDAQNIVAAFVVV